ncbi:MAG: hypothetical protein RMJ54_10290 [Roseiflexaceae bacterium]|nr:hypothetical protein [Roseiflexaceae bacterium]
MRQSASIIDTLSEGYRAIHRRPAALLLVFVFNLALLMTAPVSFAPLFDRFTVFSPGWQARRRTLIAKRRAR